MTEYILKKNERRLLVIDQREGTQHHMVILDAGAQLQMYVVLTGDGTACTIDVRLCGQGAQAMVKGLYFASATQQITCITRQEHVAPDCISTVAIRGVVVDAARTHYEGTIFVSPVGVGTQAEQSNKNMLFGATARATSKPRLEALTNDVQCAHGSAVGRVDSEQLFYVQSRGLSVSEAKKMLVEGFLSAVLTDLPDQKLKNFVLKRLSGILKSKI